jgi:hypothetical protein
MKTKDLHLKSWGLIVFVGLFCFVAIRSVSLFMTKQVPLTSLTGMKTDKPSPLPTSLPICIGCTQIRRIPVPGDLCGSSACGNISEIYGLSAQYNAVTSTETGDTVCYETQFLCNPEGTAGECSCADIRKGVSEMAKRMTTKELCEGTGGLGTKTCFKPSDPKIGSGLKYIWENNTCVEYYFQCSQ